MTCPYFPGFPSPGLTILEIKRFIHYFPAGMSMTRTNPAIGFFFFQSPLERFSIEC